MTASSKVVSATLATDDYRGTKRTGAQFREAWGFKGDAVPRMAELADGSPHPWIHLCCGDAFIPGEDRRIDLYHPSGEKIDARDLDAHVQGAGAIFMDPPYGLGAWDLAYRQKVINACMRALAPGGRLIVHAPWQPKFNTVARRVGRVYFRDDANLGFPDCPVLICAYQKEPGF